jgi:hypothetical protein
MTGGSRLRRIPPLFQRQLVTLPRNCWEIAVSRGYHQHPSSERGGTPKISSHQAPEQLTVNEPFIDLSYRLAMPIDVCDSLKCCDITF